MRKILFRGKPKNNNEFYHFSNVWRDSIKDGFILGSLVVSGNRYYICVSTTGVNKRAINNGTTSMIEVIPDTVGQYTGLTDKNGKKIFEGDIVKHHFGEEKGIVKFGEYRQPFNDDIHTKHIGFYVDWISGEQKELLRKDLGYWANIDNDYEIFIGNIHDNPELLKEADNEQLNDK